MPLDYEPPPQVEDFGFIWKRWIFGLYKAVQSRNASSIANVPAGNIAATDVQAAIAELDAEKAKLAGLLTQDFSVNNLILGSSGSARRRIKDTSNLSIADAGTQDFASFSGMVLVNNTSNGGIALFICGGGAVQKVSFTNVSSQTGTMASNSGISGYTWTNNFGSTQNYSFMLLETRDFF